MSEDISKFKKFIRPEILGMGGYSARKAPETLKGKTEVPVEQIIKLDANENPYGCSPKVWEALGQHNDYSVYPDSDQTDLRRMLARFAGVRPENIVASNGSNQLLDLICRLFVGKGDSVINCTPTFDIYRFSTLICGGNQVEVPRDEDFAIDLPVVKSTIGKGAKLIFLANPNNPSGNIIPEKDIIEILETGIMTVVDEAYFEFSGKTVLPLMSKYDNLMIIRTFSKWAGLAGMRVGFGIFHPEIAAYLQKIKIPYNVSVAAIAAVEASLNDADYLTRTVKLIIAERERLFNELSKIEYLKVYPSQSNFILCLVRNGKATDLQQKLQDKGILVRYFTHPRLQSFIRISVGKPEHTDALIKALREIGRSL